MQNRSRGILALGCLLAVAGIACATPQPAKSGAGPRAPIVAPETRQKSEDLFDVQEDFMTNMNQTNSEEAGTRHEQDVERRSTPERERGSQ